MAPPRLERFVGSLRWAEQVERAREDDKTIRNDEDGIRDRLFLGRPSHVHRGDGDGEESAGYTADR
jgi:hypothetical protein